MIEEYINEKVIVDTPYSLQYIGTLSRVSSEFIELVECDVHDAAESRATKEIYFMEAAKNIIQMNRKKVIIRLAAVVSFSKLSDVVVF